MELCNYECTYCGFGDHSNAMAYRDMMNQTGKIVPLGTDDSNAASTIGGAWIMVGAEKLEYGSVIDALEKGNLYASTGPEIHSLTWDGAYLNITCSDAQMITLECGNRFARRAKPLHKDGLLRHAQFDLSSWLDICQGQPESWFRVIVHGPYGHFTSTRAYTCKELN